jgi:glycosyl transferase, family 25
MSISIYAINLDRSADRWRALAESAERLHLPLVRVPGVDGAKTPAEDRIDCDASAFRWLR